MTNITKERAVEIINSIKHRYPELRQASKAVSFAALYGGTEYTLVKNCGFEPEEAKTIIDNYHNLYKVSDKWVQKHLKEASKTGYVTLAFGLRLRTPVLKQVLWDTPQMPYEASQEGRSAGNALSGQSYCQLTMRAANEIRERIRNSIYKFDIRICSTIHDALYFMVKDKVEVVKWLNDNLIDCMFWQELEEIQHDEVKLGAELDVFYPSWKEAITLPNYISEEEIIKICKEN